MVKVVPGAVRKNREKRQAERLDAMGAAIEDGVYHLKRDRRVGYSQGTSPYSGKWHSAYMAKVHDKKLVEVTTICGAKISSKQWRSIYVRKGGDITCQNCWRVHVSRFTKLAAKEGKTAEEAIEELMQTQG